MSGTSMDALDGVLVDFSDPAPRLLASLSLPLPAPLLEQLLALTIPGENELARMACADIGLAQLAATLVTHLLEQANLPASAIHAIGSHGQTVRHAPHAQPPFTLQLGDGNTLAELTGITTVADFRRRDMAAGGQGAPLVPAFHAWLYRKPDRYRVILNIGGMANITLLPDDPDIPVRGFDTGPGNILLDSWIRFRLGKNMDRDGQWARCGTAIPSLVERLLEDPYFATPPPKSTGREYFNLPWLQARLTNQEGPVRDQDIQASLVALTVRSIASAIKQYAPDCQEIVVCGGGAYNPLLMQGLQAQLSPRRVVDSNASDPAVDPRWMEAIAFAWLARQTLHHQPGNLPAVTGAGHPVVLGAIYPGAA
jgi:anhydro-N-acetylmuramic acid kinase